MANIFGGSMGMASQSSNIVQTLVQTVKQVKIIKPETYKLSKLLLLVCGPLSVFKLTFQVSSKWRVVIFQRHKIVSTGHPT